MTKEEKELNRLILERLEESMREHDRLLEEGFMDFLNTINPFSKDEKKEPGKEEESSFFDGHLVLDVVSLISSFIPGAGSVISFGADVLNGLWYYKEGHTFIAALYFIMAIPGVGDILALPIQGVLKFGSKGISKLIPFFPQIYKSRNLIKSFLTKTIVIEEKVGIKGASKTIEGVIEQFSKIYEKEGAEKAGEYFAKNIDKDLVKTGGKAESKVGKEGLEGFIGKAEKEASALAGKAMYRAEQNLIKRAILVGSKLVKDKTVDKGGGGDTPIPGGGGELIDGRKGCKGSKPVKCSDSSLKFGCIGDNVEPIQQMLINCGFPLPIYGVDGRFCNETKGSAIAFQKSVGLTPNGIVDLETQNALKKCNQPKEEKPEDTPIPAPEKKPELTYTFSESLQRKRYENLEKLVFKRLVKECK